MEKKWGKITISFKFFFPKLSSPDSEETICSYCVFGSIEEPKYVAAIPDREMKCQVTCDGHRDTGPQCNCHNKYDDTIIY